MIIRVIRVLFAPLNFNAPALAYFTPASSCIFNFPSLRTTFNSLN